MAGYSPTLTISSRKARNTPAHSRTPHRKADRQTHAHKHPPRPAARHDPMAPPGEATAHAPRRSGRDGERVEANDLFLLRREERGPALPYPTRSAPPDQPLARSACAAPPLTSQTFPSPRARCARPLARTPPPPAVSQWSRSRRSRRLACRPGKEGKSLRRGRC